MQNSAPSQRPEWNIIKILEWTTSYFKSHTIESPRTDAEVLLAHVLKVERIDLYLRHDQPLNPLELVAYKKLIQRRACREPVAYLTGTKEFWSRDLSITPEVLIPRPETEILVERTLLQMARFPTNACRHVLELGTGSGAIIIALAYEHPQHQYFATDISEAAIKLARQNARAHDRLRSIRFLVGDWFRPFKSSGRRFDLIVSNPPYIQHGRIDRLQPEIAKFEPRQALDGGHNGLAALERIIADAATVLADAGILILEMGYDQKEAVAEIIIRSGCYTHPQFYKDYAGHDRVVEVRRLRRRNWKLET